MAILDSNGNQFYFACKQQVQKKTLALFFSQFLFAPILAGVLPTRALLVFFPHFWHALFIHVVCPRDHL